MDKGYNFASCLYRKLRNANVFELIDEALFSRAACWDIFCQTLFFGLSLSKKERKIFEFFRNRFDIRHCPLRFFKLTLFFTDAFVGSNSFLFTCIGQVATDRGWNFRWPKVFRRWVFGESNWKPNFSQRTSVSLVALLWPNIPCMACQCWLGDGIWSVSCIQFLAEIFSEFPTSLWLKIFWKNRDLKKIPKYLKFSAVSVPRSYECHLNLQTDWAMCRTVGFDASFDFDRTFLVDLLPNNVKK